MKKRLCILLGFVMLVVFSYAQVSAETMLPNDVQASDAQIISTLVISDPETGEVWEWILPETDVNTTISIPINSGALGFGTLSADFEEITCTITTNIDISDYLNETLASTAISTTLYDDINITTGLTYSANYSTNTVSIYSVFGSTPPQGYYYASNRRVVWRNPGAGLVGEFFPYSDAWSYSTNSAAGSYHSELPPYSFLSCRINILDMTAYRDVSVICQLFL